MKGLMSNHCYYYQVQTQLLVTGFKFCDFFVWTDKDTFLETICVDTEIQADILSKTKSLFCNILLPELESKTCQWFHIKCMWIKKIPKGKLFCVKCKTKQKNKKKTIEAIKNR